MLVEREMLRSSSAPSSGSHANPKEGNPSTPERNAALESKKQPIIEALSQRSMGDAAETMEEIITLLHEAEAVLRAIIVRLTSSGVLSPHQPPLRSIPISMELSGGAHRSSSVALSTFGVGLVDVASCPNPTCRFKTPPSEFTSLTQLLNIAELLQLLERTGSSPRSAGGSGSAISLLSNSPGANASRFDRLLRELIESSEARRCERCLGGPLRLARSLRTFPSILTLQYIWSDSNAPIQTLAPVIDAIDGVIDLGVVFHGIAAGTQEGPVASGPRTTAHSTSLQHLHACLKGIVCFVDSHWVAFLETAGKWYCCNDERVFQVSSPLAQCKLHRLLPSLLFYEVNEHLGSVPADRGRIALHGGGSAASQAPDPKVPARPATPPMISDASAFPSLAVNPSIEKSGPPKPLPVSLLLQKPLPAPKPAVVDASSVSASSAAPSSQQQPSALPQKPRRPLCRKWYFAVKRGGPNAAPPKYCDFEVALLKEGKREAKCRNWHPLISNKAEWAEATKEMEKSDPVRKLYRD
jgi:hypothetical protein